MALGQWRQANLEQDDLEHALEKFLPYAPFISLNLLLILIVRLIIDSKESGQSCATTKENTGAKTCCRLASLLRNISGEKLKAHWLWTNSVLSFNSLSCWLSSKPCRLTACWRESASTEYKDVQSAPLEITGYWLMCGQRLSGWVYSQELIELIVNEGRWKLEGK